MSERKLNDPQVQPPVPDEQRSHPSRREFLGLSLGAAVLLGCERLGGLGSQKEANLKAKSRGGAGDRMPVIFVGHGAPTNVVEDNQWSQGFAAMRPLMPRPKAILAISAHWFIDGTYLTANENPRTIHDFYGFPKALYEIQYRAPGKVDLAERVRNLLGEERSGLRTDWGLDHGTWTVLHWMYPDADIPVIQLSIDRRMDAKRHYELARSLADLRHEGVLIMGSGNVTHNLRDAVGRMRSGNIETPDWARRFDDTVKQASMQHDHATLVALGQTSDGRASHPTPDHWLPLLYALAATDGADAVRFPTEGFDLGSLSMRNILWG